MYVLDHILENLAAGFLGIYPDFIRSTKYHKHTKNYIDTLGPSNDHYCRKSDQLLPFPYLSHDNWKIFMHVHIRYNALERIEPLNRSEYTDTKLQHK
jgi:hypothetical protein